MLKVYTFGQTFKQKVMETNSTIPQVIVTTTDIKQEYEIIAPVFFKLSNKGIFGSELSSLLKQYKKELEDMKSNDLLSKERSDWGFLVGEWNAGQNDFDKAFFCGVQELKKRAKRMGADAIVGMRMDIDLDTNGFTFFYLQLYGTAVRLK